RPPSFRVGRIAAGGPPASALGRSPFQLQHRWPEAAQRTCPATADLRQAAERFCRNPLTMAGRALAAHARARMALIVRAPSPGDEPCGRYVIAGCLNPTSPGSTARNLYQTTCAFCREAWLSGCTFS